MKKLIYAMLFISVSLCNQSLQAKYWKNNQSLAASCYTYIFGTSFEQEIPLLLEQADYKTLENPIHLCVTCPAEQTECCGTIYDIEKISTLINQGPTYQALQHILHSIPLLANYSLQLRKDICNILHNPISTSCYIILHAEYKNLPDAAKLALLHHEVQHHLYNDIASTHLEKILDLQSHNPELQKKLQLHKNGLQKHICRYVEYRADTQAQHAIQCPYCLQEIAQFYENIFGKQPHGTYNPAGYLYAWQFETRINELLTENKCCKYHQENNKLIDLSITDESSLLKRLQKPMSMLSYR